MSRPWMPLYVADYLADTAHLNAAESGAYLHLIMHYWQRGGLPTTDRHLATIAKMLPEEWAAARNTLAAFFSDGWRHDRIDDELAKSQEAYERRAAAGRAGGTKPKPKPSPAEPLQEHCSSNASAMQNQPLTQPQKKEGGEDRASAVDLHALAKTLFSAGGSALDRTTAGLESMATPLGWIKAGCDIQLDIVPTVRAVCSRSLPNSIRAWSYFARPVADALAQRTKPLPEGTAHHGRAKRPDGISAALDSLDDFIASRSGDREGSGEQRPEPIRLRIAPAG